VVIGGAIVVTAVDAIVSLIKGAGDILPAFG
jgi:hypothetical protein